MIVFYIVFFVLTIPRGNYAYNEDNNHEIQKFTMEFFERKTTRQLTIFACWNSYEQVSFHRQSLESKFKVSYIPIPSDELDMARILTVNYYTLGIFLDLECPRSASVLREQLPFNQTYHWLLMTKLESPLVPILKDLPLTIDTEMTVAVKNRSDYILYDVYNPSYRHGGSLNLTLMGNWNLENGLDVQLTQYKYQRRRNLAGLRINVSLAITHEPTPDFETYITKPINPHFDTMHRYHYALIRQLRDYYNFTMNLKRTDSWGYSKNGTYNGLLGHLVSGIADIGGSPLVVSKDRMNVADYVVQTYVGRASFIFRHPKKNTVQNGFVKPFTDKVWWLTMIVALLNWILLWFTARIEIHFENLPPISSLNTHPGSETALMTIAALCHQDSSDRPKLYSGRIVFLSLLLWTLLVFQYYSASIVGSLLAEPSRFIRTIKDLTESDLSVGVEDIAYMYHFFATTADPDALELHRRKIAPLKGRKRPSAYMSVREGFSRVKKGNFAFYVDVATAYKIITDEFTEDELCDLVELPLFPPQHLGTVTRKHSPFKKMVSYGMRQIIEHGMAEKEKRVWLTRRPRCPDSHSLNPVAVQIEEFSPALFLLMIGSIAAVGILFGEYYYVRWRTRNIEKFQTDIDMRRKELFQDENLIENPFRRDRKYDSQHKI